MPANYLHGVETAEVQTGARPISVVKSAVIGLIGIAPTGSKNTPILVTSDKEAAQFGSPIPGFSIPQVLNEIFTQGAGSVFVVNVFDSTTMTVQVTDEACVVTGGKFKTAFPPISGLIVKHTSGTPTYVQDTDYTVLDVYGNMAIKGSQILEGASLKVSYKKMDGTLVTAASIIGAETAGVRTGGKCFNLCRNLFGFNPKLIIAPGYSSLVAVATELIAIATKFRGHAIIDAPSATTVAQAIAGRGPAGTITFNTSSKRAILAYPGMMAYDIASNANVIRPFSGFVAGIIAATDLDYGFHFSPSNKPILGVVAPEINISAALNDSTTEANGLNEVGIMTVFNSFGTGIRTWGDRSAAFPSSTDPSNFICVQRTADVLMESVEQAMLQFIDLPINGALIDSIRESVNSFIRTLIARGALIDGRCTFDKTKNTPTDIAAGHLTFDVTFMPPTPAERISFQSFIDITLLKKLA